FKFFCILLPSLLKTNVCFYHIYLFKLREAKVEETEIIDNIESWRRLQDQKETLKADMVLPSA
ncbi:MAG: hypothetical protein IJA03_11240, partial [Bacteroidaceae bacterium]|nr:hypothetical protein [Bacteroidaceae bacterium]